MTASINTIIDFWFDEKVEKKWFNSDSDFDDSIRVLFEGIYETAVDGMLNDWATTPDGALALVILFDQFPLNMYRGSAKSFKTEALSREVAKQAILNKLDQEMSSAKKSFLYMPFMHSENKEDQQTAIDLFEAAKLNSNLKYAKHHQHIIQQFGRFPHRNQILSRTNTPQEEAYLNSNEAFLG